MGRSYNKEVADYVSKRLSTDRDDRTYSSKKMADATLRGKMGSGEANKIIRKIDEIKSWR